MNMRMKDEHEIKKEITSRTIPSPRDRTGMVWSSGLVPKSEAISQH